MAKARQINPWFAHCGHTLKELRSIMRAASHILQCCRVSNHLQYNLDRIGSAALLVNIRPFAASLLLQADTLHNKASPRCCSARFVKARHPSKLRFQSSVSFLFSIQDNSLPKPPSLFQRGYAAHIPLHCPTQFPPPVSSSFVPSRITTLH